MRYLLTFFLWISMLSVQAQNALVLPGGDSTQYYIKKLTSSIAKAPKDPFLYWNRGMLYVESIQFLSAIADFNSALALDALDSTSWGKSDKDLRKKVVEDKSSLRVICHYWRARAYYGKGKLASALKDIEFALRHYSKYAPYYGLRGLILGEQGKVDLAIKDFDTSISLDSNYYYGWRYRGIARYQIGKDLDAARDFSACLYMDSTDMDVRGRRALALINLGYFEDAVVDCNLILKNEPNDKVALEARSSAYTHLREYIPAIRDLNRLIALSPSAYIHCMRGYLLSYLGDYSGALKDEQQAYKLTPDGTYLINQVLQQVNSNNWMLGSKLYAQYKRQKLQSWLEHTPSKKFMRDYIESSILLLPGRRYQEALIKLKAAMTEYYTAVKKGEIEKNSVYSSNDYACVVSKVAWVYEQLGNMEQAQQYYRQALNINGNNVSYTANLARVQNKLASLKLNDKIAPKLSFERQEKGSDENEVTAGTLFISGYAKDASGLKEVTVNGFAVDSLSESSGYFWVRFPMTTKLIDVKATDVRGNAVSVRVDPASIKMEAAPVVPASYHAVMISNSSYRSSSKLDTLPSTIDESQELARVFNGHYGFKKENIHFLNNLSRQTLLAQLSSLLNAMSPNARVVISYGGHGAVYNGKSCWVPVDWMSPADYIRPSDVMDCLQTCRAKNVLILSDACFSDVMVSNLSAMTATQPKSVNKSWTIISSGKGIVNGKSDFAPAVVKTLISQPNKDLEINNFYSGIVTELSKINPDPKSLPVFSRLVGRESAGVSFTLAKVAQ